MSLLIFGFISASFAIKISIEPSGHQGPHCLSVSSLTRAFAPVTICAPAFPGFPNSADLANLGLKNGDEALYGFGFSLSATNSMFVKPDFDVRLKWRPEYEFAIYEPDACFYSKRDNFARLIRTPMNGVDDRAMCQHVFDSLNLRINCHTHPESCPEVQNPFYQAEKLEPRPQGLNPIKATNFVTLQPAESETQSEEPPLNPNLGGDLPTETTPPFTAADQPFSLSDANSEIPAPESISLASSITQDIFSNEEGQNDSWPLTSPSSKRSIAPRLQKSFIA